MLLEQITANKLAELAVTKATKPLAELKQQASVQPPAVSLSVALRRDCPVVIAEVKRASPSRGVICRDFNPVRIAGIYAACGSAAISVVTEARYFLGSLAYLKDIRNELGNTCPPLLRKDFILDPYQVYESRANGADAVLLIAAILTQGCLKELLDLSRELGIECLVEVHDERELETVVASEARIIGINNRDLKTFNVDIKTTERLRLLVPTGRIVVSESGIKRREDIEKMKRWGINGVLVGESLISAPDISVKMREFLD